MRAGRSKSQVQVAFWLLLFLEHGGVLATGMCSDFWFGMTYAQPRQLCICEWQVGLPSLLLSLPASCSASGLGIDARQGALHATSPTLTLLQSFVCAQAPPNSEREITSRHIRRAPVSADVFFFRMLQQ
jgi:hypothetical protein